MKCRSRRSRTAWATGISCAATRLKRAGGSSDRSRRAGGQASGSSCLKSSSNGCVDVSGAIAAKAILIHGNGGCTAGDIWLPWLERELRGLGLDVINHTFPDNVKARASYWLPHLEMLDADERTILIGHS